MCNTPLAVRCANCCAGVQYRPRNGGQLTGTPFHSTVSSTSKVYRSASVRYSATGGSCSGAGTRANSDSGTIHGDTLVANDLPRNGPSGWYSHDCRSRADQSLTSTTPNTWEVRSPVGTGLPSWLGTPTTNPSSASMSSRCDGPTSPGPRCPDGRTIGVPETTTVPARPWYPTGRCRQFGRIGGWPGRKMRPTLAAWCSEE